MSAEKIIQIMTDSLYVPYILVGVILLLSILLMLRDGSPKSSQASSSAADKTPIKVSKSKYSDENSSGAAAGSQMAETQASQSTVSAPQIQSIVNTEEVDRLKTQVSEKSEVILEMQKELKRLQGQVEDLEAKRAEAVKAASTGASTEDLGKSAELEEEVKLLKAKLKEYEIVEEDIADLSMYKDKVEQLEQELAQIKASSSYLAEEPAGSSQSTETQEPLTDDTLDEFQRALDEQLAQSKKTTAPQAIEEPAPVLTPANLLAQIPGAVAEEAAVEADSLSADLDFDQMMKEAQDLEVPDEELSAESAIGTELDTDKLMSEAATIDAGDVSLMDDFEMKMKAGS